MLVVHHLNNSRSQRVLWLLEELGLEYEVKRYERNKQTLLAPPELKAVHPLGKSPVVQDGDQVLAESGAIVEHLADRYGAGKLARAAGSPERYRYTYWLHYAEGSAMPPLLMKLIFDRLVATPMPFFVKPIVKRIRQGVMDAFIGPQLTLNLDYMEKELGRHRWFVDDEFSAADIQMSFPLETAVARGGLNESRPRLMDWLRRIHERPAYRRALERGGPYAYV
jgi:glutathione S-transferase